ncbi:MAG: helix-turn-helix transcriptional regulator [Bacteroidaceae bacterium]|nr:helix-turn-helix transcriptional regulator [Bacteroidaceae bacterium]
MFHETIIDNLRKIMNERRLTQETLAEYAGISTSQMSKVMNGTVKLSLIQLSNIASKLSLREIDIITYPEIYVPKNKQNTEDDTEVMLQLKLRKDKKDQILKLIFGNNDIEILNR